MSTKNRRLAVRPKVLTVSEFAQVFAISPRLVRKLIHRGKIPALKFGRFYRIPRKAVSRYLAGTMQEFVEGSPVLSKKILLDDKTGSLFPSPTMPTLH